MDGDGGDVVVVDEDRCLGLPEHDEDESPVDEFPLQIPSGGEVSAISGCSVCRLPDPVPRDETI